MTRAAQAVQRSAYPDAYADDEALAEGLLMVRTPDVWLGLGGGRCVDRQRRRPLCEARTWSTGRSRCRSPRSAQFTDQRNFGNSGGHWARGHTGTDLSAPCGTPVRAATAGTVVIETGPVLGGAVAGPGEHGGAVV